MKCALNECHSDASLLVRWPDYFTMVNLCLPHAALFDPEQAERELHRKEALALHARYLGGELTEAQYQRKLDDIGKEPDDLTRERL